MMSLTEDYTDWYYFAGKIFSKQASPLGFLVNAQRIDYVQVPGAFIWNIQVAVTNPNEDHSSAYHQFSIYIPDSSVIVENLPAKSFNLTVFNPLTNDHILTIRDISKQAHGTSMLDKEGILELFVNTTASQDVPAHNQIEARLILKNNKGSVFHGTKGFFKSGKLPCSSGLYLSCTDLTNSISHQNQFVTLSSSPSRKLFFRVDKAKFWFDRELSSNTLENYNYAVELTKSYLPAGQDPSIVYPNSIDPVNFGQGQLATNSSGWIWSGIHIPSLKLEILVSLFKDETPIEFVSNTTLYNYAYSTMTLVGEDNLYKTYVADPLITSPQFFKMEKLQLEHDLPLPIPTKVRFHVYPLSLVITCSPVASIVDKKFIDQRFFTFGVPLPVNVRNSAPFGYFEGLSDCEYFFTDKKKQHNITTVSGSNTESAFSFYEETQNYVF